MLPNDQPRFGDLHYLLREKLNAVTHEPFPQEWAELLQQLRHLGEGTRDSQLTLSQTRAAAPINTVKLYGTFIPDPGPRPIPLIGRISPSEREMNARRMSYLADPIDEYPNQRGGLEEVLLGGFWALTSAANA